MSPASIFAACVSGTPTHSHFEAPLQCFCIKVVVLGWNLSAVQLSSSHCLRELQQLSCNTWKSQCVQSYQ
eukprot:1522522-Amphidinium_carterae.1